MGLFFLLAGYFVEHSYDKRGFWWFVSTRLLRLGVPLLILIVFAFGSISYAESQSDLSYLPYLFTVYLDEQEIEFGPLWFIAHLLIYQLGYATWRLMSRSTATGVYAPAAPQFVEVLTFTTILGLCSATVRIAYPQDVWIKLLGVIPVEPAHIPQYLSLFVIGIVASRGQWFTKLNTQVAYLWLAIGLAVFVVIRVISRSAGELPELLSRSVILGFAEAFVCVGVILGVIVFFRENLAGARPRLQRLAENVYGVYLIHVFTVVPLQLALIDVNISGSAKLIIVTLLSVVWSFSSVILLRKVPGIRSALG